MLDACAQCVCEGSNRWHFCGCDVVLCVGKKDGYSDVHMLEGWNCYQAHSVFLSSVRTLPTFEITKQFVRFLSSIVVRDYGERLQTLGWKSHTVDISSQSWLGTTPGYVSAEWQLPEYQQGVAVS